MSTPPLGLALIKSQLKEAEMDDLWIKTKNLSKGLYRKWSSKYIKGCIENQNGPELERYALSILGPSPIPQDSIGFSVMTESQLYPSLALAWYLKRKGKTIFFGGKLFTIIDGNLLAKKFDFIDSVFSDLQSFLRYLGLEYDCLVPSPDFSGLQIDLYKTKINGTPKLVLPFILLEGCNKNCAFCVEHTPLLKINKLMIADFVKLKVEQIIQLKKKHKTDLFFLSDCAINNNILVFKSFIEELKRAKIQWGAFANAGGLDSATTQNMKKSGCKYLLIGCESGSQKVLKSMNKPHLVEDAEQSLINIKKAGIFNHCFFIVNFPTETREDFKETLKFLMRNKNHIDDAFTEIFDLRVGSYMSKTPGKYGISIHGNNGLLSQRYSHGQQGWRSVKLQGVLRHYQAEVQIATTIKLKRFINHPVKALSNLVYTWFVLQRRFPLDRLFDY